MESSGDCVEPGCPSDVFDVFLMLLSPKSNTSLALNITKSGAVSIMPANWSDLYLSHTQDRAVLRWGIEQIVTAFMGAFGDDLSLITPPAATRDAYEKLLDSRTDSHMEGNHWASTCPLGICTDPKTMKVGSTENVHVADASLLSHQLSSHPMLTVAAMARKAAQNILVENGLASCQSNPKCLAEGMRGRCCPSFDAVMLSCCAA